jgi:hypothetical protein
MGRRGALHVCIAVRSRPRRTCEPSIRPAGRLGHAYGPARAEKLTVEIMSRTRWTRPTGHAREAAPAGPTNAARVPSRQIGLSLPDLIECRLSGAEPNASPNRVESSPSSSSSSLFSDRRAPLAGSLRSRPSRCEQYACRPRRALRLRWPNEKRVRTVALEDAPPPLHHTHSHT